MLETCVIVFMFSVFSTGFANCSLLYLFVFECRYERYIFALEEASRDVLATLKDKALKVWLFICLCALQKLISN